MFRSFDPDDFSADERGSVISMSDSAGASLGINAYDEYGNPGGALTGRYGYTGQAWIASAQIWYLNARMYSSAIGGRFLQPDPIGYAGGINLYAYVGNDPVNLVDPLGLIACPGEVMVNLGSIGHWEGTTAVITGRFICVSIRDLVPAGGRATGDVANGLTDEGGEDRKQPCPPTRSPTIQSARDVLEAAATTADVATIALVAGGITGPAAFAAKGVGLFAEGVLGAVNAYDAYINGNQAPLAIQSAGIVARLAPGGRALQSGLISARGPTGGLRNARGQFRSSYLKDPAVKEAGDAASQKYAERLALAAICRR